MARKTKQDAELTKQKIIDSAIDIFYTRGVASCKINDIAVSAGLSRGAFYWHFDDKEAILEQLLSDIIEQLSVRSEAILNTKQSPVATLKALAVDLLTFVTLNSRQQKIFYIFLQMTEKNEEVAHFYTLCHQYSEQTMQVYASLFEQALNEDLIHSKLSSAEIAFSYDAFIIGLIESWFFNSKSIALDELAMSFVEQFFLGLSQHKKSG